MRAVPASLRLKVGARSNALTPGGTTYCAVSALTLLGGVDEAGETLRWLVQRQIGGFQGRPGKLEDVCYSFWCGGALAVSRGEGRGGEEEVDGRARANSRHSTTPSSSTRPPT